MFVPEAEGPVVYDNVLSSETIRVLLNGTPQSQDETSSNGKRQRSTSDWIGARRVLGKPSLWIEDRIERSAGRVDLVAPKLLDLLHESEKEFLMKQVQIRYRNAGWDGDVSLKFHLMIVQPGAQCQVYHVDEDNATVYYTFILPLTKPSALSGRTQFAYAQWSADSKIPEMIPKGSCLVFDGKTMHRGTANKSNIDRIFAFVVASSSPDMNDGGIVKRLKEPWIVYHSSYFHNNQWVSVGEYWDFQGPTEEELWPAKIEEIFHEEGESSNVTLTVRWLYDVPGRMDSKRERFYSNHTDESPITSLVWPCNVAFFADFDETAKYLVRRFWDVESDEVRPLGQDDLDLAFDDLCVIDEEFL